MSYDAQGFLIATTDPADYVHRIERDEAGNIIARIDPRGDYYRTVIEYDGANRPRTQSEPTGTESDPGERLTTQFEYDGADNRTKIVDPRGEQFATIFTFDAQNFLVATDRADGTPESITRNVERFEYDIMGNVTKSIDARGEPFATVQTYDFQNNLVTRTFAGDELPGSNTEEFHYDGAGNLIRYVSLADSGTDTSMSYDGVGRLVETINPVGEITKIDYDAFGNTVVSSNYLGTTQARYDQFDRLVEETDAIGDIRSFDYTNDSQIRETVSGAGASGTSSLVSIVDLDPLGRVVKQSDAAGSSRTIDYDGVGNQIRTVDRRGMIVETVFDARNVPLSITEAAETDIAATTTLEYDNLTRLIKETDPRGEFFAVTYVYDNLGRVIEQHTPTGTPGSARYQYDRF